MSTESGHLPLLWSTSVYFLKTYLLALEKRQGSAGPRGCNHRREVSGSLTVGSSFSLRRLLASGASCNALALM